MIPSTANGEADSLQRSKPDEVTTAVEVALRNGYHHLDSATVYHNEKAVGAGIQASGVARDQIFITSKLWNSHHRAADAARQLDATLADLQTDYLDLYLIHWPVAFLNPGNDDLFPENAATGEIDLDRGVTLADTWKVMEGFVRAGKVRSIGVSNFTQQKLEALLASGIEIRPAVNQIEAHPFLQQPALLAWCQSQGIVVEAYSPMGNNIHNYPRALDNDVIIDIAQRLGKEPAQVLVSWALQRGTVVLPKSVTPSRIKSNLEAFELPAEDVARITALDTHARYNFPKRFGVNIFGELTDEQVRAGVDEWLASKK